MTREGIVVKFEKNEAVIMTKDFDFKYIKKEKDMYLGQKICLNAVDTPKLRINIKYGLLTACAAVLVFFSALFYNFMFNTPVYAYIDLDINPSIEFSIDSDDKILKVNPLNIDATKLIDGMTLNGKDIKAALTNIIEKSRTKGYLKNSNIVVISASLNKSDNGDREPKEEENLSKKLSEYKEYLNNTPGCKVDAKVLSVPPVNRELALKNNLSMARYSIYTKARDLGLVKNIDELRGRKFSELVKRINIEKSTEDHRISPSKDEDKVKTPEASYPYDKDLLSLSPDVEPYKGKNVPGSTDKISGALDFRNPAEPLDQQTRDAGMDPGEGKNGQEYTRPDSLQDSHEGEKILPAEEKGRNPRHSGQRQVQNPPERKPPDFPPDRPAIKPFIPTAPNDTVDSHGNPGRRRPEFERPDTGNSNENLSPVTRSPHQRPTIKPRPTWGPRATGNPGPGDKRPEWNRPADRPQPSESWPPPRPSRDPGRDDPENRPERTLPPERTLSPDNEVKETPQPTVNPDDRGGMEHRTRPPRPEATQERAPDDGKNSGSKRPPALPPEQGEGPRHSPGQDNGRPPRNHESRPGNSGSGKTGSRRGDNSKSGNSHPPRKRF